MFGRSCPSGSADHPPRPAGRWTGARRRRPPIATLTPALAGRTDKSATTDTLPDLALPDLALPDPPSPRAKVLAVDDHPANLVALEAALAGLDLDLVKATSGFEALRRLLADDFALILMDVHMPGMDGFETAELIRRRRRSRHIPVIFLTGVETSPERVFEGYAHGAVDYLVKPISPTVLRSKVSVFADLYRQAEQIRRQAEQLHLLTLRAYERELAEARARAERDRLDREITLAREIQQRLFPVAPLPLPGLDVAGASFPAEATGGDYFDYIPMADGGLAVVIGDVCGHGFGPALVMAELRAYLRAFLHTRTDVGEVVGLLNQALAGDTDRFVTLLVVRLDPATRGLTYAGAGHLPGYRFGPDGAVRARLESTGIPLAVVPDGEYATAAAPALEPGELVLLTTDGLVEAHGPDGEPFGTNRVLELVRACRDRPAREIVRALYDAVRGYCGPGSQPDDMTAVVIKAV